MEYKNTFATMDEFQQQAFAYTFEHFDEFLQQYPSVMDKLAIANKEAQQKQLDAALKQREQDLIDMLKKKQQALQEALTEAMEKDYQAKLQQKLDEKQKVIDEYMKANESKTGTHSLYRGETFEKYIELLLAKRFANYTIDGSGATACMDVRMIDPHDANKIIGIECKAKKTINANDIKKFKKDKVANGFWGSIFISECKSIPNVTKDQDEWVILDNELWIQSCSDNVILSAIGSFIALLDREDQLDGSTDRQLIIKQSDFITSMYDKLHAQKQSLFEQEKQMYDWIKHYHPDKLRNHLYIVAGSKLTKRFKECPY